jgi:hypothetical protein
MLQLQSQPNALPQPEPATPSGLSGAKARRLLAPSGPNGPGAAGRASGLAALAGFFASPLVLIAGHRAGQRAAPRGPAYDSAA